METNRDITNNSAYRTIILVTLIVILGKLMGFVREILIADAFGASNMVDAFLMSESTVTVFFGWLASFAVVFTPIYQGILFERGQKEGDNYTSKLIIFVEVACIVFVLTGIQLRNSLISISAPGYSPGQKELTQQFFVIVIWAQAITHITSILIAYLNCRNRKVLSSLSLLVLGFGQLVGVYIAWLKHDVSILGYSLLIATALQFLFVAIITRQAGYRFSTTLKRDGTIYQSLKLVIPVFISSMITEINTFFDKLFASYLPEGSVSILHYSSRIRILFSYIFSTILQTVLYPELSAVAADTNRNKLKSYIDKSLQIVLALFVPIAVGCVLLSKEIINVIYGASSMDTITTNKVCSTFMFYSISLAPLAVRDFLIRVLYSLKKTEYSMYIGLASVAVNIGLNALLIRPMQHNGLAFSTSISATVAVVLYFIALHMEIGEFLSIKSFIKELIKIIFCSTIMGIIIVACLRLFSIIALPQVTVFNILKLILIFVIALAAYFLSALLLRLESLNGIINDICVKVRK